MAMPIVSGRQMAAIDQQTIDHRGIPGLALMENAGKSVAAWISSRAPESWLEHILIVAGTGNNGGDGLVIARHLMEQGLSVETWIVGDRQSIKGDASENLTRLQRIGGTIHTIEHTEDLLQSKVTKEPSLIVDALLGTGMRGVPKPLQSSAIEWMSHRYSSTAVVAVDIPSGVVADDASIPGLAVQSDHTFTFGLPKIGHLLPPGQNQIGSLHICDIGFPHDLLTHAESDAYLLTRSDMQMWVPRWSASAHKGTRGRLLVVAGSRGMSGAAILAASAAVTAGAGLVTVATPSSQQPIVAGAVWEALTLPLPEQQDGTLSRQAVELIRRAAEGTDAIVIGPGLGRNDETSELVREILALPIPLVIDADGLWAIQPKHLTRRTAATLLTPHPGELAALLKLPGPAAIQSDRWGTAKRAAEESQAVILLKGAYSAIAMPNGRLFICPTGNTCLATGGSGDVLAGVAGAFLAQHLPPQIAAGCAAYLHGAAADQLRDAGRATIRAGELIEPIADGLGDITLTRPYQRTRMAGDIDVFSS